MTESELLDAFLREEAERYEREFVEDDLVEPINEAISKAQAEGKTIWVNKR